MSERSGLTWDETSIQKSKSIQYDGELLVQLWHGEANPDTEVIDGGLAMQFAVAGPLKDEYQHYFKHVIRLW
jgi:hypothetical protein